MFKFILAVLLFILVYNLLSSFFRAVSKGKKSNIPNDEPTIITKSQHQEKMIKDNEGEYVDFEEVKEENNNATTHS